MITIKITISIWTDYLSSWVLGKQCRPEAGLNRVYTICHFTCTFWTHPQVVKSNFRKITAVKILSGHFLAFLQYLSLVT